jgi:hypothetical protein
VFLEAWLDGNKVVSKTYRPMTNAGATKIMTRIGMYSYDHPGTTEYVADDVRVYYP